MIFNTSIPESVLRKKNHSIAYHFIIEGSACGEWKTGYTPRDENVSDILTAARPAGIKRSKLINKIMYNIEAWNIKKKSQIEIVRVGFSGHRILPKIIGFLQDKVFPY